MILQLNFLVQVFTTRNNFYFYNSIWCNIKKKVRFPTYIQLQTLYSSWVCKIHTGGFSNLQVWDNSTVIFAMEFIHMQRFCYVSLYYRMHDITIPSNFLLLKWKKKIPEKILAIAAMIKLKITPGPATFLATIPATKYIPVPTQLPMPKEVRSKVVRHF